MPARTNRPCWLAHNALFSSIKSSVQHQKLFEGAAGAIHPDVAPEGSDIVVTNHRFDAFIGTDLEMILRANDVDMLFLLGIATRVVLSSLLHAIDYSLAVTMDCCADLDPQVHACLMDKVFPAKAVVIPATDFIT